MRGRTVSGLLVAVLCLSGCLSGYHPGALLASGRGGEAQIQRVGCVDLRVARVQDPAMPTGGHGVGLTFGNRCDHAVALDLGRLQVTARWSDGVRERLHAHDPRSEIHRGTLEARVSGGEVIAYVSKRRLGGFDGHLLALCVDGSHITPSRGPRSRPVCFEGTEEETWR